jgi:hypothetical protein
MLGVRRASATKVIQKFQNVKIVSYTRENIIILDRTIESSACACYSYVKKSFSDS